MTKRLDPEVKAIRELARAWNKVPVDARQRTLEWLIDSATGQHAPFFAETEFGDVPLRVRAAGEGDTRP